MVPVMQYQTIEKSVEIGKSAIVKIDVEGAEVEVLYALKEKISYDHPVIIMEVLSAYSDKNAIRIERQKKIVAFMEELNYQMFIINEKKDSSLDFMEKVNWFDPSYNPNMTNYLLFHSSKRELINQLFEGYIK